MDNESIDSLDGLSHLPALTSLEVSANASINSLGGLSTMPRLASLVVSGNPALHSLEDMPGLPNLTRLQLNHTHLTSLGGLPAMPQLSSLILWDNDNLGSLDGMPHMPKLTSFEFGSAGKLDASAAISEMTSLERLGVFVPNVAEVLAAAAALPSLKELAVDGDLVADALIAEFMEKRRKLSLAEPIILDHLDD